MASLLVLVNSGSVIALSAKVWGCNGGAPDEILVVRLHGQHRAEVRKILALAPLALQTSHTVLTSLSHGFVKQNSAGDSDVETLG